MNSIEIRKEFCPKNHACPVVPACPFEAISQENPFSAPVIDEDKCQHCGICCQSCRVFNCPKS